MKYIRTREGIFDTRKGLYTPSIRMWAIGTVTIYDEQIIGQADTIEELCDEFVVVTPKSNKFIARKKMVDGKEYLLIDKTEEVIELKNIKDYLVDLYGAIWTSKGLIYVAKMNEEGCLELL